MSFCGYLGVGFWEMDSPHPFVGGSGLCQTPFTAFGLPCFRGGAWQWCWACHWATLRGAQCQGPEPEGRGGMVMHVFAKGDACMGPGGVFGQVPRKGSKQVRHGWHKSIAFVVSTREQGNTALRLRQCFSHKKMDRRPRIRLVGISLHLRPRNQPHEELAKRGASKCSMKPSTWMVVAPPKQNPKRPMVFQVISSEPRTRDDTSRSEDQSPEPWSHDLRLLRDHGAG